MAQGKMKIKAQVPGKGRNKQRHAQNKKVLGPKKGARVMKPKKAKSVEVAKLKKGIERIINNSIQAEISARASTVETKPFILSHPKPEQKKEGKRKKKKK
ncbi:UPF0390 protein zgc136864-like [Ptychodera flava]|uniref:UPF0390 protein zgc136864-like n=1 Tax=Ptychodera flava TaxID=63121 RepID=UPI00396A9CC2